MIKETWWKDISDDELKFLMRKKEIHEIMIFGFEEAKRNIETTKKSVNEYDYDSLVIDDTIDYLDKWIKKLWKNLKKTNKRVKKIQESCEHEFKFEEESYTGNFTYYRCTKCGALEMRKS